MKNSIKNRILLCHVLFVFGIIALLPYAVESAPVSVLVSYSFTASDADVGGRKTYSRRLGQSYSLDYERSLLQTKTINLSGNVRGIKSIGQTGEQGSVESTSVTPSLNFTMNNDYFGLTSGFNSNELPFIETGELSRATTWNTSFNTQPDGFPSLRLSYDESKNKSKEGISGVNAYTLTKNTGLGTSYEWNSVTLGWRYSQADTQDFVVGSKELSPRHSGSFAYSASFLDDRISLSANFGYSRSKFLTSSFLGGAIWISETRDLEIAWYGEVGSGIPFKEENRLIDNDKNAPITNHIRPDEEIHLNAVSREISFGMGEAKRVDTIFVYVQTDVDADIINSPGNNLGWSVYGSDDGITWGTPIKSNLVYEFKETGGLKYFEILLGFNPDEAPEKKFFKVVNANAFSDIFGVINVTEIEASGARFDSAVTKQESRNKRLYGGVDFAFVISDKMTVTYNFTQDKGQSSSDDSAEISENKNISQGLSLMYNLSRYFSISSNYQYQRRESSKSVSNIVTKTGSNAYVVSVNSSPLDTINLAASFTRGETLDEGETDAISDSTNMSSFFNLYDGVDLGFAYLIQNSSSSGSSSDTSSISANLSLNPWDTIYLRVSGGHTTTYTLTGQDEGADTISKSSGESLRSTITFNPSVYFSVSMNQDYVPTYKRAISISTRLPGALQMNLSYTISESASTSLGTSTYLTLSDYLRIALQYNIRIASNNDRSQNYGVRLTFSM